MTAEELVSRLQGAKQGTDGKWMARCPAHDDRTPSLSVAKGADGMILLKCFAGCTVEAIVQSLGVGLCELFPESAFEKNGRADGRTNGHANGSANGKKRYPRFQDALKPLKYYNGEPSGIWHYFDDADKHVGVVLRWDLSEDEKKIQPLAWTPNGWVIGHMPKPRPLFNLREILKGHAKRLYVVEGEKKVDCAAKIGLLAVASCGGANAARQTDWSPVAGRVDEIVILSDHDEPGAKYAADVAEQAHGLTPPIPVKLVELPGLPEGGDIVDYVDAQDAVEDLADIGKGIDRLADAAPLLQPQPKRRKGPQRVAAQHGQPNGDATRAKDGTGYDIILEHFRSDYQPAFRRGQSIFSTRYGREIKSTEAMFGASEELINKLYLATDAPRNDEGVVRRGALPRFFASWARSAWVDLLAELPEEEDAGEIADDAVAGFAGLVANALCTIVSIGYQHAGEEETRVERRSLIDWCLLWAKPGEWAKVRSYLVWTRRAENGQIQVALRVELFGQVGPRELATISPTKFARLCRQYEVGEPGSKINGQRIVELAPAFLAARLGVHLTVPDDANCHFDGSTPRAHGIEQSGKVATEEKVHA